MDNKKKKDIREYLDRVMELEGLLLNMLGRGDVPEELTDLVRRKAKDVEACARIFGGSYGPSSDSYELEDDDEDVPFDSFSDSPAEVESEMLQSEGISEESNEEDFQDEEEDLEEEADAEIADDRADAGESSPIGEIKDDRLPYEVAEEPKPQRMPARKWLSLNDSFRFAELFPGKSKELTKTLEYIEGMGDFDEVEEYFYSELGWNPEEPLVAEFMERIRPNFF